MRNSNLNSVSTKNQHEILMKFGKCLLEDTWYLMKKKETNTKCLRNDWSMRGRYLMTENLFYKFLPDFVNIYYLVGPYYAGPYWR